MSPCPTLHFLLLLNYAVSSCLCRRVSAVSVLPSPQTTKEKDSQTPPATFIHSFTFPKAMNPPSIFIQNPPQPLLLPIPPNHPKPPPSLRRIPPLSLLSCSAAIRPLATDIPMFRSPDDPNPNSFSFSPRDPTAIVLWDLDNKPPRRQPYPAALALRRLARLLAPAVEISAYANRHAFLHLPPWVRAARRDRRHSDLLERKGLAVPAEPYACTVCGRKCATRADLRRHFRQLHERERAKKVARMRSLKGKKKERYKERFIMGNEKYEEAAREILVPRRGYGLDSELRRAGVAVRMVEDKPQAADAAVKRQIRHSMARGVDWLVIVSDDGGFAEMVGRAKEAGLRTVVIGDGRRSLGRVADFWVSWERVEGGEVGEEEVLSGRDGLWREEGGDDDVEEVLFYDNDDDDDDDDFGNLDSLVDDVVVERFGFGVSAFSEEEMWDREDVRRGFRDGVVVGARDEGVGLSWNVEDGDDCYV